MDQTSIEELPIKPVRIGKKCSHGKRISRCNICGGGEICEHDRQKYVCRICHGGGICEHDKIRTNCRLCDGGSFLGT